MRKIFRSLLVLTLLVVGLMLCAPRMSRAGDDSYWRTGDKEQRLTQVEGQVLDTMRDLSAARVHNDDKEVARLSKEFKKLQDERVDLMRATGKLPPAPTQ